MLAVASTLKTSNLTKRVSINSDNIGSNASLSLVSSKQIE